METPYIYYTPNFFLTNIPPLKIKAITQKCVDPMYIRVVQICIKEFDFVIKGKDPNNAWPNPKNKIGYIFCLISILTGTARH